LSSVPVDERQDTDIARRHLAGDIRQDRRYQDVADPRTDVAARMDVSAAGSPTSRTAMSPPGTSCSATPRPGGILKLIVDFGEEQLKIDDLEHVGEVGDLATGGLGGT
jgi:hypothetical protein